MVCALLLVALGQAQGPVSAWGGNLYGQLGEGTVQDRNAPVRAQGLTNVVAIAGGRDHSLALREDGTVWAWGRNQYGQLGDGTNANGTTPAQVPGLTNMTAIAGGNHSIALRSNGTVWEWGWSLSGSRLWPEINQTLPHVAAIAAGYRHSLALLSAGTVVAWGQNSEGQLGDGTNIPRTTPVVTLGLSGVVAIAAGGSHSLALRSDGTVWTWGWNEYGQVGDGSQGYGNFRLSPVQTLSLTNVVQIKGGGAHSLALRSDGTVWTWGWNEHGQLGHGTWSDASSPVQTLGLSNVVAIAAGLAHSLALRSDGTVWAWGRNLEGQLGDETNTDRWTPVQIQGLTNVVDIVAGAYHSLARSMSLLSGIANLQDVQSMAGIECSLEARLAQNSQTFGPWTVALDTNGAFSLPLTLPPGSYEFKASGPTWLSQTIGPFDVTDFGLSELAFDLFNGDVNGDDTVNILDFLILRAGFGSSPGSGNWDVRADLNRSGSVNVQDFLILRKNFGRTGA